MRRIIRSIDTPMSPAPAISTRTWSAEENSDQRVSRKPRTSERAPPRTTMVVPQSSRNTLRGTAGSGAEKVLDHGHRQQAAGGRLQQDHQVVERDRAAPALASPQAHEPRQLHQHHPADRGAEAMPVRRPLNWPSKRSQKFR